MGYDALNTLEQVLSLYNENDSALRKAPPSVKTELKVELSWYIDELKNGNLGYDLFKQYPRYMKAFRFRIQRNTSDPAKYREKNQQLSWYRKKYDELSKIHPDESSFRTVLSLRLMIEEFAISLFAQQEVKTNIPVSVKRLDSEIEQIKNVLKKNALK
jgi:hypothetical protein